MRLGFYYHVPLTQKESYLYLPGYLGVFVDALANEVEVLYLFFHEAKGRDIDAADYRLQGQNIILVTLGQKTPAWYRSLFYNKILNSVAWRFNEIDVLLVRSPSPLAPYFVKIQMLEKKIAYLVVGDYAKGALSLANKTMRDKLVRVYVRWNDRLFKAALFNQLILVNSKGLLEELKILTNQIFEVKTTTLTNADFFIRNDTCNDEITYLLYTGRIDLAKGLHELVQAVSELIKLGQKVQLHFAGWEDRVDKPVENYLQLEAQRLGIIDSLFFHGRKKIGTELNELYRLADIYVLPSYHEGFPRTIWEAMANSCPVIATEVGGIPHNLKHEYHAILIEPKKSDAISKAIKRMIEDGNLRRLLIQNGLQLARNNTLERQTKYLVKILEDHFSHHA